MTPEWWERLRRDPRRLNSCTIVSAPLTGANIDRLLYIFIWTSTVFLRTPLLFCSPPGAVWLGPFVLKWARFGNRVIWAATFFKKEFHLGNSWYREIDFSDEFTTACRGASKSCAWGNAPCLFLLRNYPLPRSNPVFFTLNTSLKRCLAKHQSIIQLASVFMHSLIHFKTAALLILSNVYFQCPVRFHTNNQTGFGSLFKAAGCRFCMRTSQVWTEEDLCPLDIVVANFDMKEKLSWAVFVATAA